jgi:hypothetical protein
MLKISKFYSGEEGSGLLLCIVVLLVMIGVGGLTVDMGIIYKTKGEMRKAANAAALSGAQEILGEDNDLIEGIVEDILVAHNPEYIPEGGSLYWDIADTDSQYWKLEGDKTIRVMLEQTVPTYFIKIFGIDEVPLKVISRAKATPLAVGSGAMPLGVSKDSIALTGDESWDKFLLKADPAGDTSFGKYGIISFNINQAEENADPKREPGAKPYKNYLESGYPGEIKLGDTLFTQSGSIAAGNNILEDKIRNSNYKTLAEVQAAYENKTLDYNDSRIMLIIVYEEGSIINSDLNIRQIKVSGFAYLYLDEYVKNGNERQINGYIIPRVFTSIGDENAVDLGLGAYSIRLVE